jgi:predicted PurR-regulated permease PerM
MLARALMYLALVVVVVVVLDRVAMVIAPLGTGLFAAYLLNPWVARLERRGLPRPVAIALIIFGLLAVLAPMAIVVPTLVARELRLFNERWADYQARLDTDILPWVRERLHLPAAASTEDTIRGAIERMGGAFQGARLSVASAVGSALSTATGLLRILLAVLLTPVFAIYFLSDYPVLRVAARGLIPPRHRELVWEMVAEVNRALASWVRGQLTVMLILGALYATGLALAGIPLGVAIGLLTGLMAFVPYVGVAVGLCLALVAALLDLHPAAGLMGVLATFGAVQSLDAMLITPRVLGGRVGLSPVAVIFALTLGGELLGYAGLLLAVPSAAVCKVLLWRAHRAWVASHFYLGGEAEPPEPAAPPPPPPGATTGKGGSETIARSAGGSA